MGLIFLICSHTGYGTKIISLLITFYNVVKSYKQEMTALMIMEKIVLLLYFLLGEDFMSFFFAFSCFWYAGGDSH